MELFYRGEDCMDDMNRLNKWSLETLDTEKIIDFLIKEGYFTNNEIKEINHFRLKIKGKLQG